MKRGPLRLRLQKQSQSGQQDNNGRISETGNKYFFGISCENTPILENNNRHISKNTKDGNMYSEEIMLQVAYICIIFIFFCEKILLLILWGIGQFHQRIKICKCHNLKAPTYTIFYPQNPKILLVPIILKS